MKVLLINSTPMIHEELRMLFEGQEDIHIFEETDDPAKTEGLQLIENLSPDVVVFELPKSFQRGVERVNQMLAFKPNLKVIALSSHSDRRYLNECLRAGVCGYLLKDCACEELVHAVRTVSSDRKYLSRDIRLGKK